MSSSAPPNSVPTSQHHPRRQSSEEVVPAVSPSSDPTHASILQSQVIAEPDGDREQQSSYGVVQINTSVSKRGGPYNQYKGRMQYGPPDQRPAFASKPEPSKVVKTNFNLEAKEFVYNPPEQNTRAVSAPSQSRSHSPQTSATRYAPMPQQALLGHPLTMPIYVDSTVQPPYHQPPPHHGRYSSGHLNVASVLQMQAAGTTGQVFSTNSAPIPRFAVNYPPPYYIPHPHQLMMQPRDFTIAPFYILGPEGRPQAAMMPLYQRPPARWQRRRY